MRYERDGWLDATFEGDAVVVTNLTPYGDDVYGVAIAPDGKIVAAGLAGDGGRAPLIGVVRYLVRISGRAQRFFPRPSVDHRE